MFYCRAFLKGSGPRDNSLPSVVCGLENVAGKPSQPVSVPVLYFWFSK